MYNKYTLQKLYNASLSLGVALIISYRQQENTDQKHVIGKINVLSPYE